MQTAINHFNQNSHYPYPISEAEIKRQKWFIAAREDRQRKEQIQECADDSLSEIASAAVVATSTQVYQFQTKLDTYDEATVRALMENQEALDLVQSRIDNMLNQAHKLEDGCRVFKSQDGINVFDEHGNLLQEEIIHPDTIPDHLPKWEAFKADLDEKDRLVQERQDILDYQDKLDNARERSMADDFTEDELNALEKELESDMPLAVKRHTPDYQSVQEHTREIDLPNQFAKSATNAVQHAATPTISAPGLD